MPYPRSSEQTPWWKTRIISNRYDYQNAFRPRWKYSVHLTRCPLRVVQRLMGAGAPVIRFLEAFTEWPRLRYRCAEAYACDAPWEERLGWARGRTRERHAQLQRLLSRPFSTRFG